MYGSLTMRLVRYQSLATLPKKPQRFIPIETFTTTSQFTLQKPLTSLQCGTILQLLTNSKFYTQGQQLHAHIICCGTVQENTYLNTKLAAFYSSCGRMAAAQIIFDHVVLKNLFLWNSMIRGYACNGCSIKSIAFYRQMLSSGQMSDNFTYPFVLKACGDIGIVEFGRRIHSEVVVSGLESDVYVCNSLLAMYSKFKNIRIMRIVFDRMPERDLTTWNTIISGYVKNGDPRESFSIFHMMGKGRVTADCTTLLGILCACADLAALKQGKEIHGYTIRNNLVYNNNILSNAFIEMYCCCNALVDAWRVFAQMRWKDTVSWNSMISGYARNEDAYQSLKLFCQMFSVGYFPDQVTIVAVLVACNQITALKFGLSIHAFIVKIGLEENALVKTSLMDMYSKCGSLTCSHQVFEEISEKNLVSYCVMIAGYGFHGKGREAISVFHEMKANGIVPDEGIFTSVLSACSHAGLVSEGKEIFHSMEREYSIKPTLTHYSCLVDLLGRAGLVDEAYEFIKKMEIDSSSDIWAALLSASQLHQNVELAELSAQKLFAMDPKGIGSYICLSNAYAAKKRWDDVERVRGLVRKKGLKKSPGCCFVELDNVVHRFLVGDKSHQQTIEIYAKLTELQQQLKEIGYKPDTSSVFYDVAEEIKEKMLWDHCERLAIAFVLINTSPGTIIRITKNIRVCEDCHTVTKLISRFTGREIIMRDNRRFHHFGCGLCSCHDFW